MPSSTFNSMLVIAVVANGLLAGLFFVFSVAISPGFRRVDDTTYLRSFRTINAAILNVWFMAVFLAAPLASAVCVGLNLWHREYASLPLIIAGGICSLLTLGITAAANVPLNNELEQAPTDTEELRRHARTRFEAPWNRWNHVRTVTSFAALALFAIAAARG